MKRHIRTSLYVAFTAVLVASMASAQSVLVPEAVELEIVEDSLTYLEPDPAITWWNGSGITADASLIEDGDPVPAIWPTHQYGWSVTRTARIRNTSPEGSGILTFDMGGVVDIDAVVLWNHGEEGFSDGSDKTQRGVQYAGLSWSSNGEDFVAAETLAFQRAPYPAQPIDADVQTLTESLTGITHLRMAMTNWNDSILGFSEIRMIGARAGKLYYVSPTPVNWNDPAAWTDGSPVTALRNYEATNNVVLQTPATTETFAGLSLRLVDPQRMDVMTPGTDMITVGDLLIDGAELGAGVGTGEARINGRITLSSTATFSGATDQSRDLRILSRIDGGTSIELSAPTRTVYIDNTNNDFGGTWVISNGTGEFSGSGAISKADIDVRSNGTLRIVGDWDGLADDADLMVADSPTAAVDLGTYAWTVKELAFGSSNVTEGFTYSASELNAFGTNPVFSGSGTIQVGIPYVEPEPPMMLAHWPLDEGSGALAEDVSGNERDGTITGGATWGSDGTRDSYVAFDGAGSQRIITPLMLDSGSPYKNFTYAVWANSQQSATAPIQKNSIIVGNRKPDNVGGVKLNFIKVTPTKYEYRVGNDSSGLDYNDLVVGEWHHHAFVKSGADLQYYRDGVLTGENTITTFPPVPTPFYIGGDPATTENEHFNGFIDDVVIYNFPLSSSEVVLLMNGTYDFAPTEGTVLDIERDGGNVIVSWPDAGFKLQINDDLVNDAWVDYPGGDSSPVTIPATNAAEFMRATLQ